MLQSHASRQTGPIDHPQVIFYFSGQSNLLSGESGSGKTETSQLIIRHLCQISSKDAKKDTNAIAKDSKLAKSAKLVHSVLSPFINAKTSANTHGSRAGKWSELQFNPKGKLIGMKVLDYLLEKPRVTSFSKEERNFDIFYYFLAGAKPDEKHAFELGDTSKFGYLSKSIATTNPLDNIRYHELLEDMKSIGIGKRQQHEIFKLLAAILHLGNIDFEDEKDSHNDPTSVLHYDQLECAALLLGVEALNLEST